MSFFRQYRFVLLGMLLLVMASVVVVHRINARPSRHVELREAFLLLHTRGLHQPGVPPLRTPAKRITRNSKPATYRLIFNGPSW